MIYIDTGSSDPYFNFALEYWLITEKCPTEPVFLFWQTEPTLMIGKYQNPLEEINMEYAREHGVHIVRRMSGGGTIYTDLGGWQFTFINKSRDKGISFSEYITPVIDALHQLGVIDAGFNGRNDLTIGGKKFSGNAQYIHGGYTLHHGSLLFDTDIEALVSSTQVDPEKIISKSIKSVRDRVTNISPHLPKPLTGEEFKEVMVKAIMGPTGSRYTPSPEEIKRIGEIASEKFNNHQAIYGGSPKYDIKSGKRFPGGKVEFKISVAKGKIRDIDISGDFFGTLEISELKSALIGCPYERSAVLAALEKIDGEIYRISNEELAEVITEI